MKMKKTAMLLCTLALGVFAAHAGAEVRYSRDYTTIEEAFKAMTDGDTLVLTEDRIAENEISLSDNGFHRTDIDNDGFAEMTIDLNGNTLSIPEFVMYYSHIVNIADSTNTDGKITINNYLCMEGGILNINSGTVEGLINSEPSNHKGYSYININGGQVIGNAEMEGGAIMAYYETELNVTAGGIDGKIIILNVADYPNWIVEANKTDVTGGTFTDESFVNEYVDSSLIRDLGNGSYAVGAEVAATVITENAAQEIIDDTAATGFVTTISSEDEFDLKTIRWAVTYNGVTKSTGEYKLDGVTLNGDAKIGLAVGGFADADATAAATINGYIN